MISRYRSSHTVALIGRILLSCIFLVSAYAKLAEWNSSVQMMQAKGLPAPAALLVMAVLIEGLGGLAILTGLFARAGAWALFLYLIPVTIVFHSFWDVGAAQQNIQLVSFLKNLSIMGGLALLAANGPGRLCIGRERNFYDDVAPVDGSRSRSETTVTHV
jgi:putative oxidoreductase